MDLNTDKTDKEVSDVSDNSMKGNENSVKKGIPGSTLKLIAIITMTIDHFAAVILDRYVAKNGITYGFVEAAFKGYPIVTIDGILRLVGRLGFPLFIYLLIEGFAHTRNKWKYLGRMALFAIISEIPFDMAFAFYEGKLFGVFLEFGYQNVFFTLTLGFLAIILIDKVKNAGYKKWVESVVSIIIGGALMVIAELLRTDYGAIGVIAIIFMYLFGYARNKSDESKGLVDFSNPEVVRKKRFKGLAWTCAILTICNPFEATAFFTLIPASKYNGERGINLKWIFYLFYPVHLLILWGISYLIFA